MIEHKNVEVVERANIYKNLCEISFINCVYNKIDYNKNRTNCSKNLEYTEKHILRERDNSPFFWL